LIYLLKLEPKVACYNVGIRLECFGVITTLGFH
jgi:hypothetical protein